MDAGNLHIPGGCGVVGRVMRRLIRLLRFWAPAGDSVVARRLDRWAVQRGLEVMVARTDNFRGAKWLSQPLWQFPLGAWVLQEVIAKLKPDVILETGTFCGGSAFFFASLCDLLHHGEVISVDISPLATIAHPRITYIRGSSTDPEIVACVAERLRARPPSRVLVIFDSDHAAPHVEAELESYAPLVPVGSYIHVQDGSIDEMAYHRDARPGPKPAVQSFLRKHPQFVRDIEIENRYVMTYHPYGWLKRIAPDP